MILSLLVASCGCRKDDAVQRDNRASNPESTLRVEPTSHGTNEALLLTRFTSLENFKEVVNITYAGGKPTSFTFGKREQVILSYRSGGREVISILKAGISETDFMRARDGGPLDYVMVGLKSPYAVLQRKNLLIIENLGRKRPWKFGKGDVAFYDLAETMVHNIIEEDKYRMSAADLFEKGYLNTFNHVTAQAFMTSIFSETLADFVADVHERRRMPELITGNFTPEQQTDLENGPVDNYIDMINNEFGQELGKILCEKYSIDQLTFWTPELLANYLNDIQSYHSWVFQIGFYPFRPTDEIVVRFAEKINLVTENEYN